MRLALSIIGHAQARQAGAKAGHVNRLEAFELDQPRGKGVGHAGRDHASGLG
jgi:hypothetical protein